MARVQTTSRAEPKRLSSRHRATEKGKLGKLGKQAPAATREAKITAKLKALKTSPTKDRVSQSWLGPTAFLKLYEAPAMTRVQWGKNLGAHDAKVILARLRVPQGDALTALDISVATVN